MALILFKNIIVLKKNDKKTHLIFTLFQVELDLLHLTV